MSTIGIINGANLNLLGQREPHVYGYRTIDELQQYLEEEAKRLDVNLLFFQSNIEGELVNQIQQWWLNKKVDGIIINPGGYAHTSLVIRDAIASIDIPVFDVHLSNPFHREAIRQQLITASACKAVISGLGFDSYIAAIYAMCKQL